MVNVRLTRQAVEVLYKPGPVVTVHRIGAEALVDPNDGTGAVRVTRQGAEALMNIPPIAAVHRIGVEALVDPDDGTGAVRLSRQGTEVLYQPPPFAAVHRIGIEALVDTQDGSGAVRLTRMGIEVLYPRPPAGPSPLALPSNYEVFIHDWSSGVSLSNAYMTDVTFSRQTGAEERRILREKPQRQLGVRFISNGRDVIDRVIVNARRLTSTRVPFPLYCDESIGTQDSGPSGSGIATVYCDTTLRRFFPGGRILIVPHTSDHFVPLAQLNTGIIDEIQADRIILTGNLTLTFTAGNFSVYPLIDCEYVLAPNVLFHSHLTTEWQMVVSEILGNNTLPATRDVRPQNMPLLEGIPVLNLNIDQDWVGGVNVTYQQDGAEFTRGRGKVVDPNDYRYKQVCDWNFLAETRAIAWNVVQFLDWARGRGRVFFSMDEEDLQTVIAASTTFIEVDPFGEFSDFIEAFDYVGIEMLDGEIVARRVNTIQNLGSVWRITTTGDDLPAIDLTQIRRVARVRKARLISDEFEEDWKTLEVCRFKFTTIEVLDEGEETT